MTDEAVTSPCPWCGEPVLDPCNFAKNISEPSMWGLHTCPHCRGTFILWESPDESVTLDGVTPPPT